MRGHVRKRGGGTWTVVVELDRDTSSGKRRQLWRTVRGNKRDAETLLAQLIHQKEMGIEQGPARLRVGEYLENWLEPMPGQTSHQQRLLVIGHASGNT